jgi:hypothetical protein
MLILQMGVSHGVIECMGSCLKLLKVCAHFNLHELRPLNIIFTGVIGSTRCTKVVKYSSR